MAKITTKNIETISQGILIYKFPASEDKPADDLTNVDFYYLNKIIREGFGEDTEYELLVAIPTISDVKLLPAQTTKTYHELVNGKWYIYELKL